jgi:hypothetical protein
MPNAGLRGLRFLKQVWQNVFVHPVRPMRLESPGKSAPLQSVACALQFHSEAKGNGGNLR